MEFQSTDRDLADHLDQLDELRDFRAEFVITDPDVIYLDGNSLGRQPRQTAAYLRTVIEQQWGDHLIQSWNDHWIDAPVTLGRLIAPLIGAQEEEVLVTEATSINLFKLAVAALRARPGRRKIVTDSLNFPSDLYILQGIVDLLGQDHTLHIVPSNDGITVDPGALAAAMDDDTALVCLTHVAFKSAFMYDMKWVTTQAHQAGALVLWDLSHSVGAVPVHLSQCHADLAVGCTYKYLNGGPGAPAFLYVRHDLQPALMQPIWGWFAAHQPFAFELDFQPADNISRFRVGTPPILSTMALAPSLELFQRAGMNRIRAKSVAQTDYLIYLADQWLSPLGFSLGSPRSAAMRGSHISLRHAEAYRICRALIEASPPTVRVVPDFREPDNIRLGVAPLYTSFADIYRALSRMREIVVQQTYRDFPAERQAVT